MRGVRSAWRSGVGAVLAALILLIGAVAGAAPLSFTIGTSEPVVVDTNGGTPLIWLNFGGGEVRAATYRAGSGTAALEFAYDIAAGDFAPAGIIAAGQIELAGGAIRDLAGNPLTLNFTPPDLSGVRVRTYRPVWTTDPITATNAAAAAFEITKAPLGATFAWEITSDGGGSASGSGTISAVPHPVTGLDLSALGDGTLTLSLTLTTAAGTSAPRTVTVTKEAPWTPADLGSAVTLWLDAGDPSTITIATGISQWRDKSGNSHHVEQNTAAHQPAYGAATLNGKPGVEFDGVNDSLASVVPSSALFFNNSYSAFTVGRANSAATDSVEGYANSGFWGDRGGFLSNYFRSQGLIGAYNWDGNSDVTTQAYTFGANLISGVELSSGNIRLRVNGGTESSTTSGLASLFSAPITIGEVYRTYRLHGVVSEVIFIRPHLSTSDREKVEGYLAHKWGLAGSLPVDHPWKAAAP